MADDFSRRRLVMTGKQLKNSILQWAIQGKLVPQDPNDEPASVLLEKIRAEKARLIKEGKIKKDKNESIIFRGEDNSYYEKFADGKVVCIDEEIPFEIPATWEWSRLGREWSRLGSLVDFSKSKSVKANNIDSDAWLLDLEDIEKDSGKILHKKRMGTTTSISDKHRFERGNVLYSKLRPYLNKVIIADEDGYCTSEILCFDFGMIYNKYAQLFLMSPFFVEYAMSDAYGVKMPRLGSKQGNNGLIPIPPREEQKRIVNFINSLEPYIEKYSNAQVSLDIINKEIKNTLKKSILQEAIKGKLVPQNPNDEPVSVLLQRIKDEKLRLAKEGKLKKKDVVDSVIFKGDDNKYYEQIGQEIVDVSDEIPFDLPESWQWSRLGQIVRMSIGKTPARGDVRYWSNANKPWVSISDMADYSHIKTTKENISETAASTLMGAISPRGSLLMSFKITVGRTSILDIEAYHNEAIISIYPYIDVEYALRDFLFYSLPILANMGDSKDAIKGKTLNSKSLNSLLIPLPPLKEQRHIIQKLEELYARL